MKHLSLATVLAVVCLAYGAVSPSNIVNTKVDRLIDLSSQLVKITTQITVANRDSSTPVKEYVVNLGLASHDDSLAYLLVTNGKKQPLKTTKRSTSNSLDYVVDLSTNPIAPGSSLTLTVESVHTHLLEAYPDEITQAEKQLVQYTGLVHFPTPYTTETQSTRVKVPSTAVESYSKALNPVKFSDKFVVYGPYDKVEPLQQVAQDDEYNEDQLLKVHYENNSPFLTTNTLQRSIQVRLSLENG